MATAIYDPRTQNMTVCATDSAWNRGKIVYSLGQVSGTNRFIGTYHYHHKPYRMNDAPSVLVKGRIPGPGIPPENYPLYRTAPFMGSDSAERLDDEEMFDKGKSKM